MRHYFDILMFPLEFYINKVIELRFSHDVKSVPPYNNAHVYRFPEGFLCIAQHNLLMLSRKNSNEFFISQ